MTDLDAVQAIVEEIMTQHWDLAACQCWVCKQGRRAGCHARPIYLPDRNPHQYRGRVWVDPAARGFGVGKSAEDT